MIDKILEFFSVNHIKLEVYKLTTRGIMVETVEDCYHKQVYIGCGEGKTFNEALIDYVKKNAGKTVCYYINSKEKKKREFTFPVIITEKTE